VFKEAIKFEKDMLGLKGNPGAEVQKDKSNTKRNVTLKKPHEDKKDQDSMDMESLQRMVKNISNEIININKIVGEGTSNTKKFFKLTPNKITPPTIKPIPPMKGINVEYFINVFKAWENDTSTYEKEEEEEEGEIEKLDQSYGTEETSKQEVNYFWDVSYALLG